MWRGVTQANDRATAQGSLDYSHSSGLSAGVWMSSLDKDTEIDFTIGYTHAFNDDYSLAINSVNYTYMKGYKINTHEGQLVFANPFVDVMYAMTSDYFNTDTSSTYINLSRSFTLNSAKGIALNLAAGQTSFDDDAKSGVKNYTDYKVGIEVTKGDYVAEFFFTDTNRETTAGVEQKDAAAGINFTINL